MKRGYKSWHKIISITQRKKVYMFKDYSQHSEAFQPIYILNALHKNLFYCYILFKSFLSLLSFRNEGKKNGYFITAQYTLPLKLLITG